MSGTVLTIIIVAAVLLVIAAIVAAVMRARRRRALQDRFGSEYDHTVGSADNRRAAERELRERAARRDELEIRDLPPAAAARYQEQWTTVQQGFVDEPAVAVQQAQSLVVSVMRDRGYPTQDGDERESMLSVDHADVMDRFRAARDVEQRSRAGKASTEDLRQAVQHYRTLFDRLLGDSTAYPADADVDGSDERTVQRTRTGNVSATRGTPADPAE